MAKTVTPGTVELEHGSFEANAMPDVFDARDLEYRPRLQPLGNALECRPKDRHVMVQAGNSCTGHAVAAMANAALAARGDTAHVSPYMAYALARRYDDFQGDADEGSSLRGALKGWFYHGLLTDSDWPSLDDVPRAGHRPRRGARGACPAAPARCLLPGQRHPAGRPAVGGQRAVRGRGGSGDPRRLDQAGAGHPNRQRQEAVHARDHQDPHLEGARWARVLHRRLQRGRLPRAELVGAGVGPQGVRDAALRRLAGVGVRRLGRPSGSARDHLAARRP